MDTLDQSTSALPRLARARNGNGTENVLLSECGEINQAWFTSKEDKDSLQEKGTLSNCFYLASCEKVQLPLHFFNISYLTKVLNISHLVKVSNILP